MALQIRRGNTAERLSITPLPGEPIFDTTLNQLFVGDGVTAGGRAPTISSLVVEQAIDSVGQALVNGVHKNINFIYGETQDNLDRIDAEIDLSNYDGEIVASAFRGSVFADDSGIIVDSSNKNITANEITATLLTTSIIDVVSINISGPLSVENIDANLKGSVFADNSTLLIDGVNGSINLDGTVKGDIIPDGDELYDIGSPTNKFRDLYLSGTSLNLGSAQITAVGSAIELPAGSTVNGILIGSGSGTGDGVIEGSTYKINIAADDSTIIVDTDLQTVTAQGGFFGDVNANTISTQFIDGDNSSEVAVRGALRVTSDLSVENETFLKNTFIDPNTALFTSRIDSESGFTRFNSEIRSRFKVVLTQQDTSNPSLEVRGLSNNISFSPTMSLIKIRGDEISQSPSQVSETLGQILFSGFDGTDAVPSVQILGSVSNTVSAGIVPGNLTINVANSAGNFIEMLRLSPNSSSIQLNNNSATSNIINVNSYHNIANQGANILFARGRGTIQVPSAVSVDDPVIDIAFAAYNGSSFRPVSQIRSVVDGTPGINIPGRFEFYNTNLSGNFVKQLELKSTGILKVDSIESLNGSLTITGDIIGSIFADNSTMIIDGTEGGKITTPSVTISDFLKLPVYANPTSRDSGLPTGVVEQGMVIFIQDSTGSGGAAQVQVNLDGTVSGWQNLI